MNDQELQRVFEEVQAWTHQVNPEWVAAGPEHDVHFMFHPDVIREHNRQPLKSDERPIQRKQFVFRKVYHGPGYPVDPRNQEARLLEQGLNLEQRPLGEVDCRPLKAWLLENGN